MVATLKVALDDDGHLPRETFFHRVKAQYPNLDTEADVLIEAFRSELSTHLPPLDDATATLLPFAGRLPPPLGRRPNGSSQNQRRKLRHLKAGRVPAAF